MESELNLQEELLATQQKLIDANYKLIEMRKHIARLTHDRYVLYDLCKELNSYEYKSGGIRIPDQKYYMLQHKIGSVLNDI